jgi:hypothetical protein
MTMQRDPGAEMRIDVIDPRVVSEAIFQGGYDFPCALHQYLGLILKFQAEIVPVIVGAIPLAVQGREIDPRLFHRLVGGDINGNGCRAFGCKSSRVVKPGASRE